MLRGYASLLLFPFSSPSPSHLSSLPPLGTLVSGRFISSLKLPGTGVTVRVRTFHHLPPRLLLYPSLPFRRQDSLCWTTTASKAQSTTNRRHLLFWASSFSSSTTKATPEYDIYLGPPSAPEAGKPFWSRRVFFGVTAAFLVIGLVAFVGYNLYLDDILELLGQHSAQVAEITLGDERVKTQAQQLSSSVVSELLTNEESVRLAVRFLKDVAGQEQTVRALSDLLQNLLADPATRFYLLSTLKDVGYQFLRDEETVNVVVQLALDLLAKDETKTALVDLLSRVMADETQKKVATDFVVAILEREEVFRMVNLVARDIVQSILNDDSVKELAVEFVRQVVADQNVQKDTGDALYSAVKYAVLPWQWQWRKSNGTGSSTPSSPTSSVSNGGIGLPEADFGPLQPPEPEL